MVVHALRWDGVAMHHAAWKAWKPSHDWALAMRLRCKVCLLVRRKAAEPMEPHDVTYRTYHHLTICSTSPPQWHGEMQTSPAARFSHGWILHSRNAWLLLRVTLQVVARPSTQSTGAWWSTRVSPPVVSSAAPTGHGPVGHVAAGAILEGFFWG